MSGEAPKVQAPPWPLLLVQDAVFLLLLTLAHGTGLYAAVQLWTLLGFWAAPLCVAAYPLGAILVVAIVDRLVPAVPAGRHEIGSRPFILWGVHLVFYRVLRVPPVNWLIRYSNVLRFLWLNGLGTRAHFTAQLSGDVNLLDHRPVSLGRGCQLGSEVMVSTHIMVNGKLTAKPVTVGEGAQIGARCLLSPGVTVGARAVLQFGVQLALGASVDEDANVGPLCQLDLFAHVGKGAVLERGSRLGPRVSIPAGEHWGGVPARKL